MVQPRATETETEAGSRDDVRMAGFNSGRRASKGGGSKHATLAELRALMHIHTVGLDYCTVHSSPFGPLGSTG